MPGVPLVTAADVADLAAVQAATMPDVCALGMAVHTRRPGGGFVARVEPVRTGVPCRLEPAPDRPDPAASREAAAAADVAPGASVRLRLPARTPITDGAGRLVTRAVVTRRASGGAPPEVVVLRVLAAARPAGLFAESVRTLWCAEVPPDERPQDEPAGGA